MLRQKTMSPAHTLGQIAKTRSAPSAMLHAWSGRNPPEKQPRAAMMASLEPRSASGTTARARSVRRRGPFQPRSAGILEKRHATSAMKAAQMSMATMCSGPKCENP